MVDCEEAATTHRCFNTASRPATMPCPANIEQLMKHLGRVVGYEETYTSEAAARQRGRRQQVGRSFFQSDVQLISSGNFNSTMNHSYAVLEISSQS
jgi:hypothetical protein